MYIRQTDRHQFNSLFSRTTSVSRHQKGKAILDFNEARDDVLAVASVRPYANHLYLTPAPYQSIFHRPDALSNAQPSVKVLKAINM